MKEFTRQLAKEAAADIRREFPGIQVSRTTVTGPSGGKRKQYFVQFSQDGFPAMDLWVTAEDAYDARAKAWGAYQTKYFDRSESGRLTRLANEVFPE